MSAPGPERCGAWGAGPAARLTLLVIPCALLLAGPERAPGSSALPAPVDTILVATNPLEEACLGFVEALSGRSGGDLARHLSPGGIRLQLAGPSRSGVSSRQAAASLRGFIREFDNDEAVLRRAAPVDGSPDRGFAEVLWSGRAAGTSDEIRRIFFLGLSRSAGGWKIDELRLLLR